VSAEHIGRNVTVIAQPVGIRAANRLHRVAEMPGDRCDGRALGEQHRGAEVTEAVEHEPALADAGAAQGSARAAE
jgi:hypothetical protein